MEVEFYQLSGNFKTRVEKFPFGLGVFYIFDESEIQNIIKVNKSSGTCKSNLHHQSRFNGFKTCAKARFFFHS